jgi:hypothetical protein
MVLGHVRGPVKVQVLDFPGLAPLVKNYRQANKVEINSFATAAFLLKGKHGSNSCSQHMSVAKLSFEVSFLSRRT